MRMIRKFRYIDLWRNLNQVLSRITGLVMGSIQLKIPVASARMAVRPPLSGCYPSPGCYPYPHGVTARWLCATGAVLV